MLGSLFSLHLHYDYAECDQSNCVILVKWRKSLLFVDILFSMSVLFYIYVPHTTWPCWMLILILYVTLYAYFFWSRDGATAFLIAWLTFQYFLKISYIPALSAHFLDPSCFRIQYVLQAGGPMKLSDPLCLGCHQWKVREQTVWMSSAESTGNCGPKAC